MVFKCAYTTRNITIHYCTMYSVYTATAGVRTRSSDRNEQQARRTEGVIFCTQQYGYRVTGKAVTGSLEVNYMYIYIYIRRISVM